MVILPDPKKKSAKEVLQEMEHGLFDAVLAITSAMKGGMIQGFLVGLADNGEHQAFIELIFPAKPGAAEDEPNPSRVLTAQTPAGALAMAGEVLGQAMLLENQNALNYGDYIKQKRQNAELRTSMILKPGVAPGQSAN